MLRQPNQLSIRHLPALLSVTVGLGLLASPAEAKRIPPGQSLIIMNRPHSDVDRFKERLRKHGLTIVKEVRCNADAFSVFEVQPKSGSVKGALTKVLTSGDVDLEAAEVKKGAKFQACNPAINDPSFSVQTDLQQLNFSEMHCLLDAMNISQAVQPRFTLIDTGMSPVTSGNEMVNFQQFNFVDGVNGVVETPTQTTFSGVHGTGVASVAAATTNNSKLLCGVASRNLSVKITSCRVSDDDATLDTMDVINAMTWCIDNHSIRGGAGVINMSVNAIPPIPSYNSSPVFQGVAKSGRKVKDLFVNCAGNDGLEDPSKEKYIRRVSAVDSNDALTDFSNYGNFKAAAPGAHVAAIDQTDYSVQFAFGTSFAAPQWAGAIALLMSLNPTLDAIKADGIIEKTGRKTAEGKVIPDLRAAVIKALKLKP